VPSTRSRHDDGTTQDRDLVPASRRCVAAATARCLACWCCATATDSFAATWYGLLHTEVKATCLARGDAAMRNVWLCGAAVSALASERGARSGSALAPAIYKAPAAVHEPPSYRDAVVVIPNDLLNRDHRIYTRRFKSSSVLSGFATLLDAGAPPNRRGARRFSASARGAQAANGENGRRRRGGR
jgi:hypothetical protein